MRDTCINVAASFLPRNLLPILSSMTKLAVLLAALVITALCAVLALYAMRIFLFVLLHWQAMVALSLLFYASIFLVALRQKRRAKREL